MSLHCQSRLRGLVLGSTVAACLCLLLVATVLPSGGYAALLLFPLLALVAELVGTDLYGTSTVSLSAVPVLAAASAGQPRAALLAAIVAGVTTTVRSRTQRLEQFAFNPSALVLCATLACLLTAPFVTAPVPLVVAAGLLAGLVYFAVDNTLVALAVSLDTQRPARQVLREDFSWLLPSFVAYGALAALLGLAWSQTGPWGVLAFLVPPALLRRAQQEYVERTTQSVLDLREAADRLADAHDELHQQHRSTAAALAQAIEARDAGTGGHVHRVTALAQVLLEQVDPDLAADEQLSFGFLLHDVGKIGVPDAVLRKPGPLDAAERAVMSTHPEVGYQIVAQAGFSPAVAALVLTHHERWDGRGYPQGLRGEQIPLATRVFAVADALDAMTDDRPYRVGMPLSDALEELELHSGTQFDPAAVAAVLALPRAVVAELLQLDRQRVISLL